MFAMLGWLLAGLAAPQFDAPAFPYAGVPSYSETRSDATLRRAWTARTTAIRAYCNDQDKRRRISELDRSFGELQGNYQQRFGHPWRFNGQAVDPADTEDTRLFAPQDNPDDPSCALTRDFEWSFAEYRNAINAARAVLAEPPLASERR